MKVACPWSRPPRARALIGSGMAASGPAPRSHAARCCVVSVSLLLSVILKVTTAERRSRGTAALDTRHCAQKGAPLPLGCVARRRGGGGVEKEGGRLWLAAREKNLCAPMATGEGEQR